MARINLTKTTEKELIKVAASAGYDRYEDYLENEILTMLVNGITAKDVENTKRQIEDLQNKLNKKRKEILLELKEQKEGEK